MLYYLTIRVYILDPAVLAISSQALNVFLAVRRRGGGTRYTYFLIFLGITAAVTDLVLLVLRLLRRDLRELVDTIEPVDLYNEG